MLLTYLGMERGTEHQLTNDVIIVVREKRHRSLISFSRAQHTTHSELSYELDLSVPALSRLMHDFVHAVGLLSTPSQRIDVVGISLGGGVAGSFAAQFPHVFLIDLSENDDYKLLLLVGGLLSD